MSGSNTAISRRRLLQGAGAMWLLSVSQVSLAAVSQVVAVRRQATAYALQTLWQQFLQNT